MALRICVQNWCFFSKYDDTWLLLILLLLLLTNHISLWFNRVIFYLLFWRIFLRSNLLTTAPNWKLFLCICLILQFLYHASYIMLVFYWVLLIFIDYLLFTGLQLLIHICFQDTSVTALWLLHKEEHILWQLIFLRIYMKVSIIALLQILQLP